MKQYGNTVITNLINEYIHSERDRQIVIDRLVNGMSFCELANKYYLSERQIKRIIKKADSLLIHI